MLCIGRKTQETVDIVVPPSDTPTVITLVVGKIAQNRVRLAFDAPKTTIVDRGENAKEKRLAERIIAGEAVGGGRVEKRRQKVR